MPVSHRWCKPRVSKGVQGGARVQGPAFGQRGRVALLRAGKRKWDQTAHVSSCTSDLLAVVCPQPVGVLGHPAPRDLGDTRLPSRPVHPSALHPGNRTESSGAERRALAATGGQDFFGLSPGRGSCAGTPLGLRVTRSLSNAARRPGGFCTQG